MNILSKLTFKTVFFRLIVFVFSIISLWLVSSSPVLADCSDPGCSRIESRHFCGRITECQDTGTKWVGEAVVARSDCSELNGGAGCPADEDCVWHAEWTRVCGQCWCPTGGGNTCGDPGQPSLSFINIAPTSATIDWPGVSWGDESGDSCSNPPNNGIGCGGNRGYVGKLCTGNYCNDGGTEVVPRLSCTSNTYWNVSGLAPGTTHYVYIWSVNDCTCDKRKRATFTTAPGAYVLGRVREETGAPFFRLDTEPDSCPCLTGSCEEMPNLSVSCETTPVGETDRVVASWDCNPGGAFYSTGTNSFLPGDNLFCAATMASTDYQFVSWRLSNASGVTTGDCQGTNFCANNSFTLDEGSGGGDNHLHFIVEPAPRDAWWQVIDGDIATNGGLVSLISQDCVDSAICQGFLDLAGPGGFPGIPSYLGTAGFGAGAVSDPIPPFGWIAESETVPSRVYDYAYFENLIQSDIPVGELSEVVNNGTFASGQAGPRGYHWYRWDGDANGGQGDLTLNDAISIGTIASGKGNKVILLVKNANLNIKATINIQIDRRGESFFMVIVEGDINIDPTEVADFSLPPDGLPELEGLFLAQESINTGSLGEPNVDGQLHVRGSMATTNGAINLERDLIDGNAENPAELFEYAPDFLLTFPRELTSRRLRWKEVAP